MCIGSDWNHETEVRLPEEGMIVQRTGPSNWRLGGKE